METEKKKLKQKMIDVATSSFMKSCDVIEGRALRNIVISRAKLVNIVEQSRVLCEDYVYCRLQVYKHYKVACVHRSGGVDSFNVHCSALLIQLHAKSNGDLLTILKL